MPTTYPTFSPGQRLPAATVNQITTDIVGLQSKTEVILNAKDFGAKGDGTTIDTAAVQAAIDAAQALAVNGRPGAILSLGGLRYRIGQLTISKPIIVDGAGAELLGIAGTTGQHLLIAVSSVFNYVSVGLPYGLVVLRDFTITGASKVDSGGADGISVQTASSNPVTFALDASRIVITNTAGAGIKQNGAGKASVWYSCNIINTGGRCLDFNTTFDNRFIGCEIGVSNGDYCAVFSGTVECRLIGTYVYAGNGAGILNFNSQLHIIGGSIDRHGQHGLLQGGSDPTCFTVCIDTNFGQNGRSAAETYDDVYVATGAPPVYLIGCNMDDAGATGNPTRRSIGFATTGEVINVSSIFKAGSVDAASVCSTPQYISTRIGPALVERSTAITAAKPFSLTQNTIYTGFTLSNSTGPVATLRSYATGGDVGALQLLRNSGAPGIQLVANTVWGPNYINGDLYLGNTDTNAVPVGTALRATDASGTNVAGAALTIAGGRGTGNANGGAVIIRTAPAGSSGSGSNALQDRLEANVAGVNVYTGQQFTGINLKTQTNKDVVQIKGWGTNNEAGVIQCYASDGTTVAQQIAPPGVGGGTKITFPGAFANDAAAATGGVAIGEAYRVTGGALAWRVT